MLDALFNHSLENLDFSEKKENASYFNIENGIPNLSDMMEIEMIMHIVG